MLRLVEPADRVQGIPAHAGARAAAKGSSDVLLLGMIVLGLASFAAMLAFVELCDRL
jgi:hypothetical protein